MSSRVPLRERLDSGFLFYVGRACGPTSGRSHMIFNAILLELTVDATLTMDRCYAGRLLVGSPATGYRRDAMKTRAVSRKISHTISRGTDAGEACYPRRSPY